MAAVAYNVVFCRVVVAVGVFIGALTVLTSDATASSSLAEDAYYQIEGNVFDQSQVDDALAKLDRARKINSNDPWLYLTASLAVLVSGYTIGDWYSTKNFMEGTIDKAFELAARAIDVAPKNSQCHAHFARLLIVKGDYQKAWGALNKAHKLDADSFYPWYFRGIIAEKKGDVTHAQDYFGEAEKRVTHHYQTSLINIHRQNIAKLSQDADEQERLLKNNIAKNPEKSLFYGNYANFLMGQKRYDDAIQYWKKAIELGPYREAVEQLEKAQRLKQSSRTERLDVTP